MQRFLFRPLVALLAICAAAAVPPLAAPKVRIHVIDVGQGASALFEFPCGAVLVDAGAQSKKHVDGLVAYLDRFFAQRPDLNKTLEAMYLTHCHIDHSRGLLAVGQKFTVKRFIQSTRIEGSGLHALENYTEFATEPGRNTEMLEIADVTIRSEPGQSGLTNSTIDPLSCQNCDPKVSVLAGAHFERPEGWPKGDFEDENNHSLVIRFDLGGASAIVLGDIEKPAIKWLLDFYGAGSAMDADVMLASHHGSAESNTDALVAEISPDIAVIQVGKSTDPGTFTAGGHGHPRKAVVVSLEGGVAKNRVKKSVPVATGKRLNGRQLFEMRTVRKAIYATGWDGSFVLESGSNGQFRKRKGL